MGGHYGSVQLRTADRPRVLAAAEAVARELNLKCLVGPALGGWVGVYPEGHGQDQAVGERIAAAVGGHALHCTPGDDNTAATSRVTGPRAARVPSDAAAGMPAGYTGEVGRRRR